MPRTFTHKSIQNFQDFVQIALNKLKIGGTAVTATAATVNTLGAVSFDRIEKVARVALGVADTGGGVLSWANPEATAILVERIILDVTTVATAACTLDVGSTATSATTLSDTLIDGLDVNAAIGVFDNLGNAGTNGKTRQKVAVGKWVTASKASGAAAGLAGFAYIHYVVI